MSASFIFTFPPEYEKKHGFKVLSKTQPDALLASGKWVL